MLAIFDIDGTICDTQEVEGRCFAQAFDEVLGIALETLDWTKYEEPTSSGVVKFILGDDPDLEIKERDLRDRFVQLLAEEQPKYPEDFSPLSGALDFISRLEDVPSVTVAFATGGFDTEARFKLKCCGIDLLSFPHATSSDTPRRKDIIPLAARRAGGDIASAVYFGDAPWDVKACEALDIQMIGIGRRIEQLQALGLRHTFRDFTNYESIFRSLIELHRNKI